MTLELFDNSKRSRIGKIIFPLFLNLSYTYMNKSPLGSIAFILVVIGAINWGLVGIFNFDLVAFLLGNMSILARIVYILVGLSGLYMIVNASKKS